MNILNSRGPATAKTKDNLKELLSVKNSSMTSADLYIYGEIVSSSWATWDDEDKYPEEIREFLKEQEGKDLNIYINSPGGSVYAGMAIYNILKRHRGRKIVRVDGVAASIASVIAFAGDEIIVPKNAFLMIHKPWTAAAGNSTEFRKIADDLDAIEKGIISVYEENLAEGVNIEDIKQLVEEETWLNGDEAAKHFNIQVTEEQRYAASAKDLEFMARFKNVPKKVIETAKVADEYTENEKTVEKIKRVYIDALS